MIDLNTNSYLDSLNPQQRAAVEYIDGPSLVIAGAGSGKTRVLTYKIVHLLANGYEPYRLMALTFTNKAAREMKERIDSAIGSNISSRLWMGTFHSIFLRILRSHAQLLGFKPTFTIYDASDSKSLIKNIIKELGLDDKVYKPSTIASIISNAKNAMISPQQYAADRSYTEADRKANRPHTAQIYSIYATRCRLADAMDFDDILYFTNQLLRDNPDICRHYKEFFRFILIDEYQDTNFAQHLIMTQLTSDNNAFCVVGDDAQSIYSFRGANIANILNLNRHYPTLKVFKLERNYRSTQNIINAASSLISKNRMQIPKNVYSENAVGDRIEVLESYSDIEESYLVANKISQSKLTLHDSYEDYAILYRTNAQSRVLEESLRKRNIPYRIYGGISFYQRKEVKDAICYFRLAINPNDDEALRRIINYPARGIGETTLKKVQTAAVSHQVSMWNVLNNTAAYGVAINSGTHKKLALFVELIQEFITDMESGSNAYEVAQLIYNRTGLLTTLMHDNTPEAISKQENLSELLSGINDFVQQRIESGNDNLSMEAFLSEVSLATDQDQTDDNEPKVTLMTVHAAKGLEFKNVFIVGVEEDLFPSIMSQESAAEIEEERRLLYVAITRAEKFCYITYAKSRFRNGQTVCSMPSRFLKEIDTQFLQIKSSSSIANNYGTQSRGYSDSYGRGGKTSYGSDFVNPLQQYRRNQAKVETKRPSAPTSPSGYSPRPTAPTRPLRKVSDTKPSVNASHSSQTSVQAGMRIRHERFGEGTITNVDITSDNVTITVDFTNVGEKKLLLRFAKFEVI